MPADVGHIIFKGFPIFLIVVIVILFLSRRRSRRNEENSGEEYDQLNAIEENLPHSSTPLSNLPVGIPIRPTQIEMIEKHRT